MRKRKVSPEKTRNNLNYKIIYFIINKNGLGLY
jgi:hypothetical protein